MLLSQVSLVWWY